LVAVKPPDKVDVMKEGFRVFTVGAPVDDIVKPFGLVSIIVADWQANNDTWLAVLP